MPEPSTPHTTPDPGAAWINIFAAAVGGLFLGLGIGGLVIQLSLWSSFLAVLGFLVIGWAMADHRKYTRGTPESELDGGRTLE